MILQKPTLVCFVHFKYVELCQAWGRGKCMLVESRVQMGCKKLTCILSIWARGAWIILCWPLLSGKFWRVYKRSKTWDLAQKHDHGERLWNYHKWSVACLYMVFVQRGLTMVISFWCRALRADSIDPIAYALSLCLSQRRRPNCCRWPFLPLNKFKSFASVPKCMAVPVLSQKFDKTNCIHTGADTCMCKSILSNRESED